MVRAYVLRISVAAILATLALAALSCSSDQERIAASGVGDVGHESSLPVPSAQDSAQAAASASDIDLPEDARPLIEDPRFGRVPGFVTDFTRATVRADEVLSGGPRRTAFPQWISPTLNLSPLPTNGWPMTRFPDALVLSRDTGFARPYGNNPYAGYDTRRQPFL
jgi:hypothetical protein